jgi:hypothetical protein
VTGGEFFRQAWINGVRKHYPGKPKDPYVTPWESMPDWERVSATNVYESVALLVRQGGTEKLSREQKSRFVALCWIAQIFHHVADPKPAYVADWENLPTWQQETDADIFEAVAKSIG